MFFSAQAEYTVQYLKPINPKKIELCLFLNFFSEERFFQKMLLDILNTGDEFKDIIKKIGLNRLANHLLYLSRGIMITWLGGGKHYSLNEKIAEEISLEVLLLKKSL